MISIIAICVTSYGVANLLVSPTAPDASQAGNSSTETPARLNHDLEATDTLSSTPSDTTVTGSSKPRTKRRSGVKRRSAPRPVPVRSPRSQPLNLFRVG